MNQFLLHNKNIRVSIGVPIYHEQHHLAETLQSIQSQDWKNFDVFMSVDNHDFESAKICKKFLKDPRFTLHVHRKQLGWVKNISYLMKHQTGDYWFYLAQDDVIARSYIYKLVAWVEAHPEVAVAYSDIQCFGTFREILFQPSLKGNPLDREIDLIRNHLSAVAFRGMVRRHVITALGGMRDNRYLGFCCDTTWMATVARFGELHRIPEALYRKRYHANNTHNTWTNHSPSWLERAWAAHCRDMFMESISVAKTIREKYAVFQSICYRLLFSPVSWVYIKPTTWSKFKKARYFARFILLLVASCFEDY